MEIEKYKREKFAIYVCNTILDMKIDGKGRIKIFSKYK